MTDLAADSEVRSRSSVSPRTVPVSLVLILSGIVFAIYLPNLRQVFGIHGTYDVIFFNKNSGLLFSDAEHLFATARPIAALLSNLTLLPIDKLSDIRWVRVFEILNACLIGALLMANCVGRLKTGALEALAIALVVLCVPAFTYSLLDPAAWAVHLLTVILAFAAYTVLGRSNVFTLTMLQSARRLDWPACWQQFLAYAQSRSVWWACLLFQAALYDYPPYALFILLFPVIAVLFSKAPGPYRLLLAVRDLGFVGVNLVFYLVSAKLLYLPFVHLFSSADTGPVDTSNPFMARLGDSYHFEFNASLAKALERAADVAKVSGDLWFVPQISFHWVTAGVILLAILTMAVAVLRSSRDEAVTFWRTPLFGSLRMAATLQAVAAGAIVFLCIALSAAPILGSIGGFVVYRTVAVSTAAVGLVFLFGLRTLVLGISSAAGLATAKGSRLAEGAMLLAVGAAVGASFYGSYTTMILARNEFAYITEVVRHVLEQKAKALVIIDDRPLRMPQDEASVYDQKGRAVPAYELSCHSDFCLPSDSIAKMAAVTLGYSGQLKVYVERNGYPVPGMSCEMLLSPEAAYPAKASKDSVAIINFIRNQQPLACIHYELAWHDLGQAVGP